MARPERFELPTNWFEASYSIQLSYGRNRPYGTLSCLDYASYIFVIGLFVFSVVYMIGNGSVTVGGL